MIIIFPDNATRLRKAWIVIRALAWALGESARHPGQMLAS